MSFPRPRHGTGEDERNAYQNPAPALASNPHAPGRPQYVPSHNNVNQGYGHAARPEIVPAQYSDNAGPQQEGSLTRRANGNHDKTAEVYVNEVGMTSSVNPAVKSGASMYSLSQFRWFKEPHSVYQSGLVYEDTSEHWDRDSLGREHTGPKRDYYLSPNTGKMETLVVASARNVLEGPANATWKRTKIRSVVPWAYQLALWPLNHTDIEAKHWSSNEWWSVTAKWIPTCLALTVMIMFVGEMEGEQRNGLCYEPFPYRYFGYSKAARNMLEHRPESASHAGQRDVTESKAVVQDVNERVTGPSRLFVLAEPGSQEMHGHTLMQVTDKQRVNFIFVAYTARQFPTRDFASLHAIAERAARDAGVDAFWVASQCLNQDDPLEVYRISDIVRASAGLVVVVGPSDVDPSIASYEDMLRQWGERVWTFPELLLSAPGKPIQVYVRGNEVAPLSLSKLNFTAKVFTDSQKARSLIDHYEGTTILSRLELTTLAYECIQSRDTETYLPGDRSYALMGLLNLRAIHPSDSAFQAFARISLLNDSDRLLERLICMLPAHGERPWSATTDQYKARLWDIEPDIQISGIGEDDTVVIDGARAAGIRWKNFKTVYSQRSGGSWKRLLAALALRSSGLFFYGGILLALFVQSIGVILLLYGLVMIGLAPWLLRLLYGGKFWDTQAWMFSFEGYMPIEAIEKKIFGARLGRLEWSPYSSPLSRHEPNEHNECVGVDPTTDEKVRMLVNESQNAQYGQQRIFTLVDTHTMTVTLFQAARPPIGVLLVGSEGGMQRAIGVSLDWESQTLVRETVLRLETPVISRMGRIPRVKLNLGRNVPNARPR